jgi:chromosome segregation ATPase
MNTDELEQKIKRLYHVANTTHVEDTLQDAIAVIKHLRLSQGQQKRRKEEFQQQAYQYREEMEQQSLEILQYQKTIEQQNLDIKQYSQQLQELALQKQQALANLDRTKKELERIDTEVKIAVAKVKDETSILGKFSRMIDFLRTVFIDDIEIDELMKVDHSSPNSNDARYIGQSERD